MKTSTKVALAVTAVIVVAVVVYQVVKTDEEPPIIVKNGSMIVDGEAWSDETAHWRHASGGSQNDNELWVLIRLKNGTTCGPAQGRPVHVEYHEPNGSTFIATINLAGSDPRMIVAPKGGFEKDSTNARLLRHATDKDGGYITGVRVNKTAVSCDITQDNLDYIRICSVQAKCQ
jgi:hypothetical protein